MNVYVFGNEDVPSDSLPFKIVDALKHQTKNIDFIKINPNEDLPFIGEKRVIILDTVAGIDKVIEINNEDLDKLIMSKSSTVHDFDLGFQLKYLQKIGKLGEVKIIGIPMNTKVDQRLIQSILRKLVAQDMQGS